MHKQKENFGCGLYAVANALNLPLESLATPARLEESKKGHLVGHLTKALLEEGYDLSIEPLFFSSEADNLPEEVTFYRPADAVLLPVLIQVQFKEGGKNHLVAAHIRQDRSVLLFDSLTPEPTETGLEAINEAYFRVFGLFSFHFLDSGEYVFLNSNS